MRRSRALLWLAPVALALQASAQEGRVPSRPPLITPQIERAIENGLGFLARSQNQKEGSWRSDSGDYPVAMTGLAGLALMSSGSTPTRGPHAPNVARAVNFVLSMQQPNGLISSPEESGHSMYGHGFAMLLLAQAYGMEEDVTKQRRIKAALERGIQLTARAQSRDGGWIYTPDASSDEGSVTVTQIQALRACRNAGIHVPKEVIDRAIRYIERSQNPDGGISYSLRQRGSSRPAISAAACAVLYNAGVYDSDMAGNCFKYAWKNCKPRAGDNGHYYYTHLYMAQAVWQKGDKYWKDGGYFEQLSTYLLTLQQGNGSWNGDWVGTVYGTAIVLVILQLPYSRLPIMSR